MFSVSTRNNPTLSNFVELGSKLASVHRHYKGTGITVMAQKKQTEFKHYSHSLKQDKCTHEMSPEVIIICLFVNICFFLTKQVRSAVPLRSSSGTI